MAGVSLYKISQWLGYSDFKTTQIYAHLQASDNDIDRL
jgi:site-specific recombinase XerD